MDRVRTVISGVAMLIALATPALAVDGVIEINQAAVFAGGITPGDMPGFPATLSASGSYRLTGNLDVTKLQNGNPAPSPENITAIEITADNATLDLNGFAIGGPTTCDGASPPVCSPTGTGVGVKATGRPGLAVLNGIVQGVGGDGVALNGCNGARIERVRLHDLGGTFAILCNRGCQAVDNQITNSHTVGINAGSNGGGNGSIVRGNSIATLLHDGIVTAGLVSGNTVRDTDAGIATGVGSTIVGNQVTENRSTGINTQRSTIINNQVSDNTGNGIFVQSSVTFNNTGSVIVGNGISNNGKLGIDTNEAAGSIGFGQNVLNGNNGGDANPQTVAGMREIPAGSNVCRGTLVCP